MRHIALLAIVGATLSAQTAKTVIFDYAKDDKTADPKLTSADNVKFQIVCVNPISWTYTVKLEERNINPFARLPFNVFPFAEQLASRTAAPLTVTSSNPQVVALAAKVTALDQTAEALAKRANGLGKKAKRYPATSRDVCDRAQLTTEVAAMRAESDALPNGVRDIKAGIEQAREEVATLKASLASDTTAQADLNTIETHINTTTNPAAAALEESLKAIPAVVALIVTYETALKSLDTVPFVNTMGKKPAGQFINVAVTRKVNPEAAASLDSIKAEPDVAKYLATAEETKEFQMFVESTLPVVFHAGYGYTRIKDIKFDRVPKQGSTTDLVLGRTSEANGKNNGVMMVSYELQKFGGPKLLKEMGLFGTFGTQLDDKSARQWFFGASLGFSQRMFFTLGTSLAERVQLAPGATEGSTIAASAALPTVNSRALKLFIGVTFKPYK